MPYCRWHLYLTVLQRDHLLLRTSILFRPHMCHGTADIRRLDADGRRNFTFCVVLRAFREILRWR